MHKWHSTRRGSSMTLAWSWIWAKCGLGSLVKMRVTVGLFWSTCLNIFLSTHQPGLGSSMGHGSPGLLSTTLRCQSCGFGFTIGLLLIPFVQRWEPLGFAAVWAFAASWSLMMIPGLLSDPSQEESVTVKTIIRGSFDVIPVKAPNGFFAHSMYVKFWLRDKTCFLRLLTTLFVLFRGLGAFRHPCAVGSCLGTFGSFLGWSGLEMVVFAFLSGLGVSSLNFALISRSLEHFAK